MSTVHNSAHEYLLDAAVAITRAADLLKHLDTSNPLAAIRILNQVDALYDEVDDAALMALTALEMDGVGDLANQRAEEIERLAALKAATRPPGTDPFERLAEIEGDPDGR
jgi:hypothetical protein